MAGLIYREAGAGDQAALQRLFAQTTMEGTVRVGSERSPDHFAGAAVQAEVPCVWGAFTAKGEAAGAFSAGVREVWLGGKKVPLRYLADLRISPERRDGLVLARGFQALKNHVFSEGEWAQTLVLENNTLALDFLQSRRAGLPEYREAGRYLNWLLPAQKTSSLGFSIRQARPEDLPKMQRLLDQVSRRRDFSPVVRLADLGSPYLKDLAFSDFLLAEKNGKLYGLLGLWNQNAFQRLRIDGYAPWLALFRPLWNLSRSAIPLPLPGQSIPLVKATALACRDDDPAVLRSLLAAALPWLNGKLLSLGLSEKDPLVPALAGLKSRLHPGRHFLVGWSGSPPAWQEPFGFDPARI